MVSSIARFFFFVNFEPLDWGFDWISAAGDGRSFAVFLPAAMCGSSAGGGRERR